MVLPLGPAPSPRIWASPLRVAPEGREPGIDLSTRRGSTVDRRQEGGHQVESLTVGRRQEAGGQAPGRGHFPLVGKSVASQECREPLGEGLEEDPRKGALRGKGGWGEERSSLSESRPRGSAQCGPGEQEV